MAALWLGQADLENALTAKVVLELFDDQNVGSVNATALASVIDRAEGRTLSWLVGEYGPPPLPPQVLADFGADTFLKYCALQYAIAFTFDRHPENVRAAHKQDVLARIKDADEMMERVMEARQRPPTVPDKPANVGGFLVDNGPRIYVDSADGTQNSGDF